MEAFSALLALCAGNSPVNGEFPSQRPVTRSFDVSFNLRLNKYLSKQSRGWWFETPLRSLWRHRNTINRYHSVVIHCTFSQFNKIWCFINWSLGLGLGLQGLYSATNCADNILGRFTIILQNQIARVDLFTNLTKRWVFRFRFNASISSHNLISFGKQFHARGPYTANARLPKVSCLNFGTFRTRSSLDLTEYLLLFDGVIIS